MHTDQATLAEAPTFHLQFALTLLVPYSLMILQV